VRLSRSRDVLKMNERSRELPPVWIGWNDRGIASPAEGGARRRLAVSERSERLGWRA